MPIIPLLPMPECDLTLLGTELAPTPECAVVDDLESLLPGPAPECIVVGELESLLPEPTPECTVIGGPEALLPTPECTVVGGPDMLPEPAPECTVIGGPETLLPTPECTVVGGPDMLPGPAPECDLTLLNDEGGSNGATLLAWLGGTEAFLFADNSGSDTADAGWFLGEAALETAAEDGESTDAAFDYYDAGILVADHDQILALA